MAKDKKKNDRKGKSEKMPRDVVDKDWQPPELGKRKEKKPGTPGELTFDHQVPQVY